ncbi:MULTISPECIES: hypothetical protein [Corallococcus]|uniref:hypothetical protein n=1 Tax=Corallococcus TaxID=83461 RepID=UPI001315577A|nr:hypothetical protein [Corallococcus sp. AB038B]NPD27067.1 hypothetical protein [Corallococcus exiguus]
MPAPKAPPKTLALLDALEQQVGSELGSLKEGVQPLLDSVREGLVALDPPGDGMLPSPQEQEKLRAKLTSTLEEAEDVLEALQLAVKPGGRSGG